MTVVLLHGLARSNKSMDRLGRALTAAGFDVLSLDYPSRRSSIAELAVDLTDLLIARYPGVVLDAVTHSLGGIVFRHLTHPALQWRRAVMLAPPNQGSQIAASLASNPLFRWFYGPAGTELAGAPRSWPTPACRFAIIAGTRNRALVNPTSWVSQRQFDGRPNDGTVAVDETALDGMAGHATVDATHTTIMNDVEAQRLTIAFLRDGVMA